MMVGDHIGYGCLVLTGPNVPHNWVSDIEPGKLVRNRDMLIQFSREWADRVTGFCPELGTIRPLYEDAVYGVEFLGATALAGQRLLAQIGAAHGAERVVLFLQLMITLARDPGEPPQALAAGAHLRAGGIAAGTRRGHALCSGPLQRRYRPAVRGKALRPGTAGIFAFLQAADRSYLCPLRHPCAHLCGLLAADADLSADYRHLLRSRFQQRRHLRAAVRNGTRRSDAPSASPCDLLQTTRGRGRLLIAAKAHATRRRTCSAGPVQDNARTPGGAVSRAYGRRRPAWRRISAAVTPLLRHPCLERRPSEGGLPPRAGTRRVLLSGCRFRTSLPGAHGFSEVLMSWPDVRPGGAVPEATGTTTMAAEWTTDSHCLVGGVKDET